MAAKKKTDVDGALHAVTKNTHTPDVHYLDNSPNARQTVDTVESAENARLTGVAEGQRTRTSTARFTDDDLADNLSQSEYASGETVVTSTHQ